MGIQVIKAELYDLQFHNCNGRFTVSPDGFGKDNRPCSFCVRILELQAMLRKVEAAKGK